MLSGCSVVGARGIPAASVLGRDDLDPASLALVASRTAEAIESIDRTTKIAGRRVSSRELTGNARCIEAIARSAADADALSRRLAASCRAFPAGTPAKVTGYYEPELSARRERMGTFVHPIYAKPADDELAAIEKDLGHVPTRKDIDRGRVLAGQKLEIAWVDDPVALFFLHVQGSGKLVFEDDSTTHVGFAASNGLPYRSIGAVLRKQDLLERGHATAPEIRTWLAAHPDRRDEILFANERYIFFRDTGSAGAVGSSGVELVPGRSIATDEKLLPRGTFAWLRTTPSPGGAPPVSRFVFSNDAGAAITGPARVDLFEGSGEEAGRIAGIRNDSGELFMLLCRCGGD